MKLWAIADNAFRLCFGFCGDAQRKLNTKQLAYHIFAVFAWTRFYLGLADTTRLDISNLRIRGNGNFGFYTYIIFYYC